VIYSRPVSHFQACFSGGLNTRRSPPVSISGTVLAVFPIPVYARECGMGSLRSMIHNCQKDEKQAAIAHGWALLAQQ